MATSHTVRCTEGNVRVHEEKKKETNMGPGLLNVVFDGETPINGIV